MAVSGSGPRLIATWDGECLAVDGERWLRAKRSAAMRESTIYLCGAMDWPAYAKRYMDRSDSIGGPKRGVPCTATMHCYGGAYRVVRADTWGLPCDAPAAHRTLTELSQAVTEEGERWAPTAAGLAGRMGKRILRGVLRQLRPRWRWFAHGAIHSGPMVALTGGAPDAIQVDRKEAYLRAMTDPVPVPGSWVHAPMEWRALQRMEGVALATCYVDPIDPHGAMPPLPMEHRGVQVHPEGLLTGQWPIAWLRWAERERGVQVVKVHDAIVCRTEPCAEPLARRFARVASKALRRLLYTRWWGRLASLGWWTASPFAAPGSVESEGLHWTWAGRDLLAHNAPIDYRPDWSAWIVAHNAMRVHRLLGALPAGSVSLTHVDAVWTSAPNAERIAERQGGWAVKSRGMLRVYGIGTYDHAGKLAAQGYPEWEPLDTARLQQWATGGVSWSTAIGRTWEGGVSPAESIDARSRAPQVRTAPIAYVPLNDRSAWTFNGWAKEGAERVNVTTIDGG